jgi:hypothetical protein
MTQVSQVVESNPYLAKAAKMLSEAERAAIVGFVAADPLGGAVIKGTGGLRKMRVALAGRGKRGGGRVIYWYHSPGYPAVLIWIFAKNEADDITDRQRKQFAEIGNAIIE